MENINSVIRCEKRNNYRFENNLQRTILPTGN